MKELITIEIICQRYGCERHTAAAIIRKLPHFKAGKTLQAYAEDLADWERDQMIYPLPKGGRKQQKQTAFIIERRRA